MFNSSLKKEALRIHEQAFTRYNASHDLMSKSCEKLYGVRTESVELVKVIQDVINSIANKPKEFDTHLGTIVSELRKFKETEQYAAEAYNASVKAGVNIAGGAAAGLGVATMAPSALMSIATTFGTASTGTAISALSGAAAQKAAVAWIGRTFAGFAVSHGAGMAAGQAFLALAGPVGWTISGVSAGISLMTLANKNKKLADKAVSEAKEMTEAREALDEVTQKVNYLMARTEALLNSLKAQKTTIISMTNLDYMSLEDDKKLFLGSLVNNTLTLAKLLNETVS